MNRRLTRRRPGSYEPLGSVNLKDAAEHLGIPAAELPRLLTNLGIPLRDHARARVADFQGRGLADLQRLYLERLAPPTDSRGFWSVRRDWKLLQLPAGDVDEALVRAARAFLKGQSRSPNLLRLGRLLPYDAAALRPVAERLLRERHIENNEARLQQLAPAKQHRARQVAARLEKDGDERLDRHVAVALGCEIQHLNALYRLGFVDVDPTAPQDGRRYARDPGTLDREAIRHRLKTAPPRITPSNVKFYRTARLGFELDAFEPHPRCAVDDALELFSDQTTVPCPTALARILGGDPQQFVDHLIAYASATGKPIRWQRKWTSTGFIPTLRDVTDAMHPDAPLALTAADPHLGSPTHTPEPAILQKVFALDGQDDRTRAGIIALEGRRKGIGFQTLRRVMLSVTAILPLFEDLDPALPHHADAVLGPYGLLTDNGSIGERRRLDDVLHYKIALEISASWFNRLPPDQQVAAARFRLAWPSGSATLFNSVGARMVAVRSDAADDRDDRLAEWIADPDRTMAYIMQKAERTFAFHDAVEACIAWADRRMSQGKWDGRGAIHRLHEETFAEISRGGRPISQRILFSIESWESKCARLRAVGQAHPDPYKKFTAWLDKPLEHLVNNGLEGRPDASLNENRYVVVVHEVVPTVPGQPTSPPHWLEVFAGNVLDSGTRLSPELAEERALAIKATGLSDLTSQLPTGLFNYAGTVKRTLARHVREALGEVCIPIHEITHGTALATFSASARYDLPERSDELSQTTLEEDDWDEYTDPLTKETYGIFQQVRKHQTEASDFIFSPYTLGVLTRLTSIGSKRLFAEGEWPMVIPSESLRVRGFGASTYVVTDGRRVLQGGQMAALFYFLVGGIGKLKPHDVKHLLNAIARRENVPLDVRRRWNHHADARTTEGYGRAGRAEKNDDTLTFLRIQQGRVAGMLKAAGVKVVASDLPYVTARETLNQQRALAVDLAAVFERHGSLDQMDAQLAVIRGLDEQILTMISGQAA